MKKRIINKWKKSGAAGVAASVLAALSCLLVLYYILFPSRGMITSDTVDTLMWAQASFDGKTIFNPDFEYAALLPFGGYLLMWPLVGIFGVTVQTQVFGMTLFFIIFAAAVLFFARQLRWEWNWSCGLLIILLLALSSSAKLREIYWEHVLYYSLGTLGMLVGLGLLARCQQREKQKSSGFLISLLLLFGWCVLTGTDQIEMMLLFLFPLFGAVAAEWFFDLKGKVSAAQRIETSKLLLVIASGMLVGFIVGAVIKQGHRAGYQNAYSGFSALNNWLNNAMKFPEHWFSLLGVSVNGSESLASLEGIFILLRVLAAGTLFVAPIAAAVMYPKIEDYQLRIQVLFHWIMSGLLMVVYICGKLSAANWRLSPMVASAILLTVAFGRYLSKRPGRKRLALLVLVPVALQAWMGSMDILKLAPEEKMDQGLYQLSEELQELNLDYGYATFWNANGLTVVSDSKVKVRGVDLTDSGLKPITYQSNRHWFEDQPDQDTYFFLLTGKEYRSLAQGHLLLKLDHQEYQLSGDYVVLVYHENVMTVSS